MKSIKSKSRGKPVDIAKLLREHPNDPHIGQGYNDARGEVPDDSAQCEDPKTTYLQNNSETRR